MSNMFASEVLDVQGSMVWGNMRVSARVCTCGCVCTGLASGGGPVCMNGSAHAGSGG